MKKLIISSFLFISCYGFKNISNNVVINKNSIVAVIPLINNSETPMSGFKAKNIIENELFVKKINVYTTDFNLENDYFTESQLKEIISSFKTKNIDYLIYGYVNEWRYRSGIDSEPAVSLTLNLYDLKNDKVIWSASGSLTRSSYQSVGTVSQKLIKKLLSSISTK